MKYAYALLILAFAAPVLAEGISIPPPPRQMADAKPIAATKAAPAPEVAAPVVPSGPAVLVMRGLDKITGRPTDIIAPVGKPVEFATLTITARYCYSTPPSETPETAAFVQIVDHRPDQAPKQVFSGWMYASSPGLNGMQHPLYDVWAISCKTNAPGAAPAAVASSGPAKVLSPDSSDKDVPAELPEDAGQ
jgi:hypothetical protein